MVHEVALYHTLHNFVKVWNFAIMKILKPTEDDKYLSTEEYLHVIKSNVKLLIVIT